MAEKNFRDKLIFSRHPDGTSEREGADARSKAAQHQATPVVELNNPAQTTRVNKPIVADGNPSRAYIESIKAGKLQES